ncbi:YrhA family protein [Aphanizomenon flos-aquae NRERC-008]|uniref:YrhA family protein n=1 Tax=Aphanizomenon flos-aquae TaxID=1176 RepID=UPI00287F21DF|nr:YrhA family protein [Aphanizomenon flos-aquae]MDS9397093.1 YrhA family protein [Aphanizomenon flos-aquae NRERC-008]
MTCYHQFLEIIAQEQQEFQQSMQPPCNPQKLIQLKEQVENQLNCTLPDGYIEFLSITNGLEWNGLQIFASETMPIVGCADVKILGFVDLNLIYRENEDCLDLLFFGESGIDSYVYCISAKQYQILDRVSLSLTETFDSFEMLIYEAFQSHL